MKDLRKKKKKVGGGRRRRIVEADSRSVATCREIPEDILVEILVRLPVYSLMRFKCVSRLWLSLISSRHFTNLFYNFSSSRKRERRVFIYDDDQMLFSSSPSTLDSKTYYHALNLDLTLPCIKNDHLEFVNAVRGLMCFSEGREIQIINFTTRQVLNLPLVESNLLLESESSDQFLNYFGYDPINDEYKVLSIISPTDKTIDLRYKVLVLGEGASWRNTKSLTSTQPPHDPYKGISINDVLYYGAWSHEEKSVLMSFDFNSEEFNLIELPMEYRIKWDEGLYIVDLMNYKDQVALVDGLCLLTEFILNLWVLEDAGKIKWSQKVFYLPCHSLRVSLDFDIHDDIDDVYMRGTDRRGELRLSWRYVSTNKNTHAFYDLDNNRITRGFVTKPPYSSKATLWEEVESIMYLEV